MAYRKISYSRRDIQSPILRRLFVFPCLALPSLIGVFISNFFQKGPIAGAIAGVVFGGLMFFIFLQRDRNASFNQAKCDFEERGFQPDVLFPSCILIDSGRREIAFVDTRLNTYELYEFSDIREWSHDWVEETTSNQNVFDGRQVNVKNIQAKNSLVFKTNSLDRPLMKISVPSYAEAELWMAKISLLLNSKK